MAAKTVKGPKNSTAPKGKVLSMKKNTTVKAGTPAAKPAAAKAAKPAAKKVDSKFIGKTTGMRVQAYQDKLMKENYKAKMTDAQLAKAMRAEFPNAVAFTEAHVAGIRSQWNHGKRTSQEGAVPAKPLAKFDESGNELNPRARSAEAADKGVKAKKAKAAKKAAAPVEEEEEEEIEEDEEEEEEEDEDVEDE